MYKYVGLMPICPLCGREVYRGGIVVAGRVYHRACWERLVSGSSIRYYPERRVVA